MKIQLGIGSYAFGWAIGVPGHQPDYPMSVLDLIKVARDLEADCVQLGDNFPLETYSNDDLAEIKACSDKNKINIEVGMRGLNPDRLTHFIRLARYFNSPILRAVIDEGDFKPSADEVVTLINEVMPVLRNLNVILAIENHDRFHAHTFRYIIEATDADSVGICLDSVNSLGKGEGFFEVANILLPYTVNFHVKDYVIRRKSHQMGFDVKGTPAGKGMMPLPWVWKKLNEYKKCHSMILELWPAPENSLEETIEKERIWVNESMSYLNTLTKPLRNILKD